MKKKAIDVAKATMVQAAWMLGVADALAIIGISMIFVGVWYRSKIPVMRIKGT